MQDSPFIASIVGAFRYLADSGLWPYFSAFVLLIVIGCALAPKDDKKVQFFD